MKLYCLKYNNYYNRIVKQEQTLADYLSKDSNYVTINNVSFNPSDGVNTTQVINTSVSGDYVIVAKDDNTIISRWFIIEARRERTGQYTLTLHRDLIVDNYEKVINSPCFIEKATLLNDDPMIFNSENMTFNQIKKNEYQLKDETECPWIVAYIPQNVFTQTDENGNVTEVDKQINIKYTDAVSTDSIKVTTLQSWQFYPYCNINPSSTLYKGNTDDVYIKYRAKIYGYHQNKQAPATWNEALYIKTTAPVNKYWVEDFKSPVSRGNPYFTTGALGIGSPDAKGLSEQLWKNLDAGSIYWRGLVNRHLNLISSADMTAFRNLNGKQIVETSTGIVYDIKIVKEKSVLENTSTITINSELGKALDKVLVKSWDGGDLTGTITVNGLATDDTYSLEYAYTQWSITLTPAQGITATTTILSPSKRYHPSGTQFDMICMPYSDVLKIYSNNTLKGTADSKLAIQALTQISAEVGSDSVYDVQLLPFCPVREYIIPPSVTWSIDTNHTTDIDNRDYDFRAIIQNKEPTLSEGFITTTDNTGIVINIYDREDNKLINYFTGNKLTINNDGFTFSKDDEVLFTQTWVDYSNSYTYVSFTLKRSLDFEVDTDEEIYKVLYLFEDVVINRFRFDYGNSIVSEIKNQDNTVIGHIFYCSKSSFTFNINNLYDQYNTKLKVREVCTVTNPKIQNETEMWRLSSPNYNGQFEFSVVKNNGVKSFNVDINFRPYNPYIHINPDFNLLYGEDFNDSRGLICGGDFSLPLITNAWANYQQNNKNYENMFGREIQNLEVQQKYQRISEIANLGIGTIKGAVSGFGKGGPIGAVTGMLASGLAGAADLYMQDQLRNEALDYKRDMYGYQLGNIQALPQSISKVSPYTLNNKIFPILEYYTCTEEEKVALENKIKYNGMSVGRIGTINEFIRSDRTYIKGQLIRCEGLEEDFHYLNSLSEEIYKGAFY